jgi:tetratricopeptide (TPR) repeat protein
MSAKCDKAYFYRAQIYKRIGKADAALRDFRRVMELNPRNIDAAREVRLHRMRGGRPTSSDRPSKQPRSSSDPSRPTDETKTGLFGRLFKKT